MIERLDGSANLVLQEARLTVLDSSSRACVRGVAQGNYAVPDAKLCAAADGRDACQGDSGGPLVSLASTGTCVVIGVTSYGVKCADDRYPGVYANVTEFLTWIRATIGVK